MMDLYLKEVAENTLRENTAGSFILIKNPNTSPITEEETSPKKGRKRHKFNPHSNLCTYN